MKRIYVIPICLAVSSHSTAAAQEGGGICNALLEHGISNVLTYSSEMASLSVIKDDYCGTSYSSMSSSKQASFEVVIKKLPVGARGGKTTASEQYEYFCRTYDGLDSTSNTTRYQAAQLYDKAIDAWRDCVALSLGGTVVRPSIHPSQKLVDFTMSVTSGEARFTGVDTTNMACRMGGENIGENEDVSLTANALSVRCERSSSPIELGNTRAEFYPDADVKVKTSTGDYRVDLLEMMDGPANDRLDRIEAGLAGLRSEISDAKSTLSGLGQNRGGDAFTIDNPRMGNPDEAKCPQGTFISRIHATRGVGGKYAVDGISEIQITCSPVTP